MVTQPSEEELVTRYQCEILRNGIVERLDSIEKSLEKFDISLDKIWKKIDGRPSWAVLVIITFQTSLIVGLIVGILLWK